MTVTQQYTAGQDGGGERRERAGDGEREEIKHRERRGEGFSSSWGIALQFPAFVWMPHETGPQAAGGSLKAACSCTSCPGILEMTGTNSKFKLCFGLKNCRKHPKTYGVIYDQIY